jgi:hypothetical protein
MAEIRVTCPMCNVELAIGEEHLGKEIECGSCLQPFVAEDPKTKKTPYKMKRTEKDKNRDDDDEDDDDRPRKKKKRRRRDDDEDDYDYSPPSSSDGGSSALGVVSLIFGILSFPLLCCCYMNVPASLIGIATGAIAMSKPASRGLGIAGLALSILSLLLFGGIFMIGAGAQMANPGRFR